MRAAREALQAQLRPFVQAGTSGFDAEAYLRANPDVAADPYWSRNPEEHYRVIGAREGRQAPMTAPGALQAQQALIGLGGQPAQREAIAALEASPEFQALTQQGENALLQQASATGGLRGGNLQGALAQFRPQLLAQLINQQYGRLGGLTTLGQASAAGVGAAGQQTGAAIADLLAKQGAATAGGQIARGSVARQGFSDLLKIGSTIAGSMGGFGGLKF